MQIVLMRIFHDRIEKKFTVDTDSGKAYLEYETSGNTIRTLSVFVPESQRGKGIAKKLLDACIAYSHRNSLNLVPVCSYAKKKLEKQQS